MLDRLRAGARALKAETIALYLACRDPRTPWFAKALALLVVVHTFSPIDLIPDFIPVLVVLAWLAVLAGMAWFIIRLVRKA
jgi:uncharacterized membrane protein YkvA (DUF1232 family)